MLHQAPETFALTHPASLWTGPVKVRFLDCLSQRGNVRVACARVGLSAETAYRQRRRDPVFARGWAAATALARRESEQALADRALDGVEDDVWYRGEVVGTRRRFDTRLLLAHLARLDKAVSENPGAEADAERFDELLAIIAGEDAAELVDPGVDPLPPGRAALVAEAVAQVTRAVDAAWDVVGNADGELEDEDLVQYHVELDAALAAVRTEAEARYDAWLARAHGTVDALLDDAAPASPLPAQAPPPRGEDSSPPEPCQRRQHPLPDEAPPASADPADGESTHAAASESPEQAPPAAPDPVSPAPAVGETPPEPAGPPLFRPVPRARIRLAEG